MSDLALNASGINHWYGKQQALIDVAFSLPKGTRCGLIGPDGAGKSSLLACLAGLRTPDAGSATIDGEVIAMNELEHVAQAGQLGITVEVRAG